ncbi:hypothetical protein F4777DRAFT_554542 [Nemania sp. FL0916]|nr:hypothetical protein F4777DRAFT_554542 [Nemania sp. FL0916]
MGLIGPFSSMCTGIVLIIGDFCCAIRTISIRYIPNNRNCKCRYTIQCVCVVYSTSHLHELLRCPLHPCYISRGTELSA